MQEQSGKKYLEAKDIFEVADELKQSIEERSGKPNIPTGIEPLDDLIWGVHRKELLIVASRPSQGKTSLTLNMAWNIAKSGCNVLYASLEMSAVSCLERILCCEFEINGWRLRKGYEEERKKAISSMDKLKSRLISYPITILDDVCYKREELSGTLLKYRADVFFIDHLQRISSAGYRSRQECLADYVQECKKTAMEYNLSVVLASQINRQGSEAGNAMDFMKGTGEIEEAGDTILQLNWVGREKMRKDPEDVTVDIGEYQIGVIKQRHGAIDSAKLRFDVANYRFLPWEEKTITFTPKVYPYEQALSD
jgi:replicative DNA helicase